MEVDYENNDQFTNVNFVACCKWVKRGVSNSNPSKVQLSKKELIDVINSTKNQLKISKQNDTEDRENGETSANTEDEFNFENYDAEDENNTASLLGISSLAEIPNETEDNFSESDDSEKEDEIIKPTDNLVIVGHIEGDNTILEVYVYNEIEEAFYVHHDVILSSYPLCLEWLNYEPKMPKGNYCAVGSLSPIIDVWDLDIINSIEPAFTLGRLPSAKTRRPRVGHKDAVLALSWNSNYDHVMASGSVDKTILLWDMENKKPNTTISVFEDKVQCLEWHKLEAQTLLAGGCDNKARVFDCRNPEPHQTWDLKGFAEKLIWHPMKPFVFLTGTNTGSVQCFDCRKGEMWSIEAHEHEIRGLVVSNQCPGLLITAAEEELVKVWDCNEDVTPSFVNDLNLGVGQIFCLELSPDSPFVITVGGDKKSNNFTVYDLQNNDIVRNKFEGRELVQLLPENTEEIVQETNT